MPRFSVKKPLTVFVAVLAVLVLGVVAYLKMTPDLLPNMNFPYVIIVTTDPGASPEAIEADVTRPVEQSMATLNQIKSVTSTSQDSVSMVVLEFEDGVNMDTISVDIQQKLSALQGSWGDTVSAPFVLKINPSMLPVEVAAVSYDGKDIAVLSDFVSDTLTGKLDGITGVARVTVSGNIDRQLHVILDQKKLDALSQKLSDAISAQLDSAEGQLNDARSQIENAKSAIHSAGEDAVYSATEQALLTLQQGMDSLRSEQTKLQNNLKELAAVQAEKIRLEAQNAAYELQLEAIRNDSSLSEEERAEAIAAIENDSDYIKLQADLAALDVRIAALGTSWEEAQATAEKWQAALEDISARLKELEDSDAGRIARQVSTGVMTLADGAMQLISANVQMDLALAQIDEGYATLAESRTAALDAADLGSTLNISTITALLTAQNFSMPAGYLQEDGVNYMVSVGDEITSREDLENMVLFDMGLDGIAPIRLSDVAEVFITDNADEVYTKLNGSDGLIATFTKQSTYATADVSGNIRDRFDELEEEYPGLSFVSLMDQGEYIYIIINSILSSLGWGALFSVLILYLFLRDLRPTVITLCAIPISLVFAVVLMYFSGVTINMISLSGLAVAVGMLVDNSVVVIENIYRLRAMGASVTQAAVSGAKQVLGAITASTLTTVFVFAPIVFVEGITRQLFTDLALTMTYSLLASLIVALTLVPAMAAGMLKKEKPQKAGLLDRIYPAYRKAISWSLQHKLIVLAAALLLLVGSAWAALARGFTFMPEIDIIILDDDIRDRIRAGLIVEHQGFAADRALRPRSFRPDVDDAPVDGRTAALGDRFRIHGEGGILPDGFDLRAGIEILSLSGKGDAGEFTGRTVAPENRIRIQAGGMRAEGAGYPDHVSVFIDERLLRVQVVHVLRPVFDGRVAQRRAFFHVQLDSTGVEIGHIVTRCRAAFDEVAVRPLFDDDERMLELSCARCIQTEITLERHLHMDALRHIDEGAAGPDGIVQCRKFMIIRCDQLPEVRLDELRVFLHSRLKVDVDDALRFQLFLDIVIDHFRVVLRADTGERFLLRFRDAEAVKGVTDILREILPARFHVRLRTHIGIDVLHIQLGNIRSPRREVQLIVNRKSL